MKTEDLHLGADVVSKDGHKLGTLSRFVVNKDAMRLTHIVVDTGLLRSGDALWKGGWGLSHDRVLPLGALASATSDELRITMSGDEFKEMSVDYIEEGFAPMPDVEPGRLDVSDIARFAAAIPGEPGTYFMYEKMAKTADEVDIKKDSPVWRLNPHQKIGEVERLIFDDASKKVRGVVVRRGHFFSKDVVLPVERIVEVVADIVRIEIDDEALGALEEFKSED